MITPTMPFGKHKGVSIDELPPNYVTWLRENVEFFGPLAAAFERVHGGKFKRQGGSQSNGSRDRRSSGAGSGAQPDRRSDSPIGIDLNSLRRKYAAKYHPDRPSGSAEAMRAINEIFDELETKLDPRFRAA